MIRTIDEARMQFHDCVLSRADAGKAVGIDQIDIGLTEDKRDVFVWVYFADQDYELFSFSFVGNPEGFDRQAIAKEFYEGSTTKH
jgi:hypothetical protein